MSEIIVDAINTLVAVFLAGWGLMLTWDNIFVPLFHVPSFGFLVWCQAASTLWLLANVIVSALPSVVIKKGK